MKHLWCLSFPWIYTVRCSADLHVIIRNGLVPPPPSSPEETVIAFVGLFQVSYVSLCTCQRTDKCFRARCLWPAWHPRCLEETHAEQRAITVDEIKLSGSPRPQSLHRRQQQLGLPQRKRKTFRCISHRYRLIKGNNTLNISLYTFTRPWRDVWTRELCRIRSMCQTTTQLILSLVETKHHQHTASSP